MHSARFAGPDATYADNCTLLLARLADVAPERRTARFVTVAIARWPDGREVAAFGSVEGRITETARGEGGFGYDPVFAADDAGGATFAELTATREARDLASRPRVPYARRGLVRAGRGGDC